MNGLEARVSTPINLDVQIFLSQSYFHSRPNVSEEPLVFRFRGK